MSTTLTRLLGLCLLVFLSTGLNTLARAAERVTWYHNDLQGSPVVATDRNGEVVWREAYKPYGQRTLKEDGGSNKLWYTGKAHEEGTRLSYYGARWYHPEIGRFMSVDPVDFTEDNVQSFNRYAYANNNPYKFVDPDGQAAQFVIWGLMAAATAYDMAQNNPVPGHENDGVASIVTMPGPVGVGGKTVEKAVEKVAKGLTTPKKYFESKTKPEVKDALEKKFGPPKSSREHADTYYNDKTKRSYNVHEEPRHNDGKPHVDIRRRGGYEERKYDLKEGGQ